MTAINAGSTWSANGVDRRTLAPVCVSVRSAVFTAAMAFVLAAPAVAKDPNNIATGFAVADGNWLVTARHVIQGKPCVAVANGVVESDGASSQPMRWEAAKVLASNARLDVAVLHLQTRRPPLSLALWPSVPIGLEAAVVGYPQPALLGRSAKITQGLFSGIPEIGRQYSLLQLSASIELGNSGGPVLSPDGLVIGMVRARAEPAVFGKNPVDAPQLVNFAVNSGAIFDFLVTAGVTPQRAPVATGAAARPFETFRRAQPSVLLVVAGDWRGDEHPTIAGQKLTEPLVGACGAR